MEKRKLVVIESPFKGNDWSVTRRNILYARLCVKDCLQRGEAPYASHLFFTQTGILDDTSPDERMWGIESGISWGDHADLTAVYEDFGISKGMEYGIRHAEEVNRPVEYRRLQDILDLEAALRELNVKKQYVDIGHLLF